ncbi:MAG: flagellin [Nitrospirota bacterium]
MAINDISLTSGMRSNLLSLQQTQQLLDRTQERLSTGKKVNTPIDDPVNYFVAKAFMDRAGDITLSKDNMSNAIQTIKAADAGIKAISALIDTAKSIATSAKTASGTTAINSYEDQFETIMTQINNLASGSGADATFNGKNLLGGTGATYALTVDLGDSSTLTVSGFDGSASGLGLSTTVDWNSGGSPNTTNIDSNLSQITTAIDTLRTNTQKLSANLNIVTIRQDFANNTISILTKGADNLTLADMNEEGANMLMLQTRQALSTTALSISSQASQSVLRLF